MGTIARAAIRPLRREAISQLVDTGAAARAGAAALPDLFYAARPVIDDRVEIAMGGRMAEADQHGLKLIMLFKPRRVKCARAACGDPHMIAKYL